MAPLPAAVHAALFELLPDGVLLVGPDGRIVAANPAAHEIFGYGSEELYGKPVEQLIPIDRRPTHRRHMQSFFDTPRARPMGVGLHLVGLRRDGVEVPVEISLSPLPDEVGDAVLATVRDVTEQRRFRDFSAGALRASEEERRRIARELHDDTAQRLATLLVRLRLLWPSAEEDGEALEQFRGELEEAAESVRRIARGLRPPELADVGLSTAIRAFARSLEEGGGPSIELELEAVEDLIDEEAKLVLYRVVQEALSNVVRHAEADHVRVELRRERDSVVTRVCDTGNGFSPSGVERSGRGLGLVGMRERAIMIGGRLVVDSEPGSGTTITVRLPLEGVDRG